MYEIEMQVKVHQLALTAQAEVHNLARTAVVPRQKLERSLHQLVVQTMHIWNERFHTEVERALGASSAVVATSETKCVECAAV